MSDDRDSISFEEVKTNALERVQRDGSLSSENDPDEVALEVYALYEHAKDAMRGWHRAADRDKRYFRGEQLGKRPEFEETIVENEMLSIIETMKPGIVNAIDKVGLIPVRDDDMGATSALNERIRFALKLCGFDRQKKKIVHNMLVDGGANIKLFDDVSAVRIDPRRLLREPEGDSFDSSHYIIDQVLATVGETVATFGKKAKVLKGSFQNIEANADLPTGPLTPAGTDTGMEIAMAPVNQSAPVLRYAYEVSGSDFNKSKRVLRLEIWIRDRSTDKNGKPKYPHGRVVNVGVGADEDGRVSHGKRPDLIVMMDRPNAFTKLYEGTERKDRNGVVTQHGRFPFVQVLAFDDDDLWAPSIISQIIPLQDALNDTWNGMATNVKAVNSPKRIIHGLSGIEEGDLTNAPGEEVILDKTCPIDPANAIIYTAIPPIVHHLLPMRAAIKDAIRDVSGIMDVTRGEKPGSVTAASAIGMLTEKADSRIVMRGEDVSEAYEKVVEGLAYIAQEFDDGDLLIPNDNLDDKEDFSFYDPEASRDAAFNVVGVRRKSASEIIEIMMAAGQIEAESGMGEMVLENDNDPTLRKRYIAMKQAKAQEKINETRQAQDAEFAKELTSQAMSQINPKGNNNG